MHKHFLLLCMLEKHKNIEKRTCGINLNATDSEWKYSLGYIQTSQQKSYASATQGWHWERQRRAYQVCELSLEYFQGNESRKEAEPQCDFIFGLLATNVSE